jgi:transcriptional regulator with XRE-family HTH domain
MTTDETCHTTQTSLCLILLRETRLERGIHQAHIADALGKSPSAWTKTETGRSPLTFEDLFRACRAMNIWPSALMAAMERYEQFFIGHKWAVVSKTLAFDEDLLLREAQEYYGSPGFRSRNTNWGFSALNGPHWFNNTVTVPDIFRFCLDPEFRAQQLNPSFLASSPLIGIGTL